MNRFDDESLENWILNGTFLRADEITHVHDEDPSISSILDEIETGLEDDEVIECDEVNPDDIEEHMLLIAIGATKAPIFILHLDGSGRLRYDEQRQQFVAA